MKKMQYETVNIIQYYNSAASNSATLKTLKSGNSLV